MKFTTEHKQLIRQHWAKPLLRFLTKQFGQKLIYLGLPSPETEDVLEWLEYLRIIIAFQCDDERYPDAYSILFEKLAALERQGQIESFQAYRGYIEKVILQGRDENIGANSQTFNLGEVVTLYNLDFCNSVDSPLEFLDDDGDYHTVYKFDAVKKLLEIQERLSDISSKFVLFLTVHCSFRGGELESYLADCPYKEYVKTVRSSLKSHDKNARIVRLFVLDALQGYFRSFRFIPKVLPTIFYQGLGSTYLLHFTILGTRCNSPGPAPWLQDFSTLIQSKFVTPGENSFINLTIDDITEHDLEDINPVSIVAASRTFKKYWKSK
jgi:hypothetical protein